MRRFAAAGALAVFAPAKAEPLDVAGVWLTEAKDARFEISDCGDGAPCGVIAWVDPAAAGDGIDANNPDPTLRGRPLVGLRILWDFERKGEGWRSGKIYDPEDGKTYRSRLQLLDSGDLRVKGCAGPFCRSLIWTPLDPSAEKAEADGR